MSELTNAKKQRTYLRRRATQLCNVLENTLANPETDAVEIQVRVLNNFNTPTSNVHATASESNAQLGNLGSGKPVLSSTAQVQDNANVLGYFPNYSAQLPQMNLPLFSGNYADWPSFRDSFRSMIHDSPLLQPINKLHYLRSSLKGDAAKILTNLPQAANNYLLAWDKLVARYEKPDIITESLIEKFINLPRIKDNGTGISSLVDNAEVILGSLDSIGGSAAGRDPWLIFLLKEKCDPDTQQRWSDQVAANPNRTLDDFIGSWKGECPDFIASDLNQRQKTASNLMLCFNCLRKGHGVSKCPSKFRCSHCQAKHHSLLHVTLASANVISNSEASSYQTGCGSTQVNIGLGSFTPKGILATATVFVYNALGIPISCRVLLDPGSESTFITTECAKKLQLPSVPLKVIVNGMGGSQGGVSRSKLSLTLISHFNRDKQLNVEALTLQKITPDLPVSPIVVRRFDLLRDKNMADPYFFRPGKIDILLGAFYYYDVICPDQIVKLDDNLKLMNTVFGWVVGGGSRSGDVTTAHSATVESVSSLDETLRKFWLVDDYPNDGVPNSECDRCEEHFVKTVSRLPNGRFSIKLPFKNNQVNLGDSFRGAKRRFFMLQNRLAKDSQLKEKYYDFIHSYLSNSHMEIVTSTVYLNQNQLYYLPHLGVMQKLASSKKLRVVFDASFKSDNGRSLNDELMTGPCLLNDIRLVLFRFRMHRFVFSCDIEKMFRQISVSPEDRDYLRLIWQADDDKSIKLYRMTTLPFGLYCSPFLAERCLLQLSDENQKEFPIASDILRNNRYVDDIYAGHEEIDELLKIRDNLRSLLNLGQFPLKKWVSNNLRILAGLDPSDLVDSAEIMAQKEFAVKSLGLFWIPLEDSFSFRINLDKILIATKRKLLSESARIFDPFGWLSPVTVFIKQLFQELWLHKLSWDEEIPIQILKLWERIRKELPDLETVRIPRWLQLSDPVILHGFSDASQKAYGAVIYLVSASTVKLLYSRTKVAPLRKLSIPRLELCAAHLLAQAVNFVENSGIVSLNAVYCWSDSQIVLAWLKRSSSDLKEFVGNRVSLVQELAPNAIWGYVTTKQNPADLCSRGMFPSDFCRNSLWWNGPDWLCNPSSEWPKLMADDMMVVPELKKISVLSYHSRADSFLIERFSKLSRLIRVTAWCLRFLKKDWHSTSKPLSVLELDEALRRIILLDQMLHFHDSLSRLSTGKTLTSSDKLQPLNPFLDDKGLIRIGGRLKNCESNYDSKFPIVLSPGNLSTLIIRKEHEDLNHLGAQSVLSKVRQRYWILKGRSTVAKVLFGCLSCYKSRPKPCSQLMGDLPADRVVVSRPFAKVGVDYAGPFHLRQRKGRGKLALKYYIALFICFVTKAVHLELVTDLTTEACLGAVCRFSSRRGRPAVITSDNGKNFVGAKNYLDSAVETLRSPFFNDEIKKELALKGIDWQFIPARAPEFGGLWEAAVKSCKRCLIKCAGSSNLTIEEFLTLWLNDPGDPSPITPSHFLIGGPLKSVAECHDSPHVDRLDRRFAHMQEIFGRFWSRWSSEYLSSLQIRNKNRKVFKNVEVGDVGLIKEDNVPPLCWRLAKVTQTHPGSDGLSKILKIEKKIDEFGELSIYSLQYYLDQLESAFREFSKYYIESKEEDTELEEYDEFEDRYVSTKSILNEHLDKRLNRNPEETLNQSKIADRSLISVLERQNEFKVDRSGLSDAEKLDHLLSLVSGEAASFVKNFAVTNENYHSAWGALVRLYEKPYLITNDLIETLLAAPIDSKMEIFAHYTGYCRRRDPWIVYLILQKFNRETAEEWAREVCNDDCPTVDHMLQFLKDRCDSISILNRVAQEKSTKSTRAMSMFRGSGHKVGNCSSTKSCYKCNKRHHTLLHSSADTNSSVCKSANFSTPSGSSVGSLDNNKALPVSSDEVLKISVTAGLKSSPSLLPTAIVAVYDINHEPIDCRVMLDSGAQDSLISEHCIKKLGLKRNRSNTSIEGIGASNVVQSRGSLYINIESKKDSSYGLPVFDLADPDFDIPSNVDIVLSVSHLFAALGTGKYYHIHDHLWIIESKFGWLVAGGSFAANFESVLCNSAIVSVKSDRVEIYLNVSGRLKNLLLTAC
ncbi:uncharacterized protein LOC122520377 [Polistes fuscatus]|uniref:uncharacterized protein LOC122520377 n=1 Tax=Polistes fuscatus TaxID=30207 RepID=UPI001CA7CADF|nr:uncharacterized protein LOC122520377 [Polistes fuscatus]